MMKKSAGIWILAMFVVGVFALNILPPVVEAQSAPAYKQVGANQSANQTWQNFWKKLYWLVIIVPSLFIMAVPWVLWAVNYMKAQHEEDPQAEMKAKKWMTTAIVIDIIMAMVMTGLLVGLAYWLAS